MEDRNAADRTPLEGGGASPSDTLFPSNEELLSGTGSIPLAASSTGAMARAAFMEDDALSADSTGSVGDGAFSTASAPAAPRYVRQRTPHRSQGTVDGLSEEAADQIGYTHDSNISVGGATPLSGMAYRRSRSNISRVKNNSRYGQYLEIPKGRRTIFASRERARRRRSVLALFFVIALLMLAAMVLWNMMQKLLG